MKLYLYYLLNRFRTFFFAIFLLLLCFAWFLRYEYVYPKIEKTDLYNLAPQKNILLEGLIIDEAKVDDNKITLNFKEIEDNKTGLSIITIYSDKKLDLSYGDKIRLTGNLDFPPDAPNPDEFSYKKYLERKGIFTLVTVNNDNNLEVLEKETLKDFKYYIIKTKKKVLSVFYKNMPKESADFVSSLVFGSKSVHVSKNIQQDFTNTGLAHVLAASGMQVTLIMATGLLIISWIRINQILGLILIAFSILFYMAITDFPPSILRAGLINLVLLYAFFKKETVDSLKVLFFIAIGLLFYDPLLIHDIGFHFSILASFSLIYASPILAKKMTMIPYFLSAIISMIVATQLFVLPIQIYYFSQFSLLFLPANLISALFVDLLTYFSIITITIGLIIPFIAVFLGKILYFLITIFLFIVEKLADNPYSLFSLEKPSVYSVILIYAVIFIFIEFIKEKDFSKQKLVKYNFLLPIIVIIISFSFISYEKILDYDKLKVTFLNIGQGDSTLIQTPEGKNILIDCGQAYEREIKGKKIEFDASKRYILPYFIHNGIKKIDILVLTHPDSDHIGGCSNLLDSVEVKEIWDSGQKDESKIYSNLFENILKKNIPIKIVNKNDFYAEKNLNMKVINQINPSFTDDKSYNNNNSVLLKLNYKNNSFLFCADIEKETENKLLEDNIDVKADILKVGHHGSKTSSTKDFLEKVNPKISVISVGKNNTYKHPAPEVLERIEATKSEIYRTDKDGGVIIKSDGNNFFITKSSF